MKKTQLIIALVAIFITMSHTNSYADACTNLGVTTGDTCYQGTIPSPSIATSTNCTDKLSGCKYKVCGTSCRCSNTVCPSNTSDCTKISCNPIWGGINSSTHIQTGIHLEPDEKNDCACKESSGIPRVYRCESGYYDTRTGELFIGSTPTCQQCPSWGNNNVPGQSDTGITIDPTNKGILSCYIPYNTEITDDTGTYIFTKSKLIGSDIGCKYSVTIGPQLPIQ